MSEKSLLRISKVYMQWYSFDRKILISTFPRSSFFNISAVIRSMIRFLFLLLYWEIVLAKIVTYVIRFQVELQCYKTWGFCYRFWAQEWFQVIIMLHTSVWKVSQWSLNEDWDIFSFITHVISNLKQRWCVPLGALHTLQLTLRILNLSSSIRLCAVFPQAERDNLFVSRKRRATLLNDCSCSNATHLSPRCELTTSTTFWCHSGANKMDV